MISISIGPSVDHLQLPTMLTGGPLVAHCWVPFMVVLWWLDQLIDSGPLLAANKKVYWWAISGPLSAANDKLFYWSTGGPPSVTNNVDWWPLVAHCWVPFMVVLWWHDQLTDSGPLLAANDKLLYWSPGGSPSLANNPDSLTLVYLLV